MLKRMVLVSLATWSALSPPAVAGTYQVRITNESPYCVSVVGVAVPGADPAKGVFLHFPGPQKTELLSGKTIVGSYDLPRPARTVQVQGGPCKPTARVPRQFAHADQEGRARNVFTIVRGPNETIRVK